MQVIARLAKERDNARANAVIDHNVEMSDAPGDEIERYEESISRILVFSEIKDILQASDNHEKNL